MDITRTLNGEGIANPTGRPWSKNGVHIILRNEAYTGTLVWGEGAKDKGEPIRVEKAFPAIVTKTHCRSYSRATSGQDSKGGKFAYYVYQSLMKRGSGACDCPKLNARRFEEMVVGKIRTNILTEGNIRELVKLVDEEMDGVAKEQRVKLETVEAELADVRRRLERLYNLVETIDMDIEDFQAPHQGP